MAKNELNQTKSYGAWRHQKYYATKAPTSLAMKLFISAGLLIQRFGWNVKALRNGVSKNSNGKSQFYMSFRDGEAIMIDYDTLPKNSKAKIKLPNTSKQMYEFLIAENKLQEDINKDIEFQNLKLEFEDLYNNQWPRYLKFYIEKIQDQAERILFAKAHSLILGILACIKSKWPLKIVFAAYRQIIVDEIDSAREPVFYTFNYVYFLRKLSTCRRKGIPETLVHEMRGVPREFQVKMTGQIKAFIRILLRLPQRLTIRNIIERVYKKFKVALSSSTIKSLKKKSLDRNVLEYDANGKEWGRQNGLPKIIRFIAEAAGEQFQGDWYKTQIYCLLNSVVIRLWAYVVLDVYSKKMVGWALSEKQTASQAKRAFKMAFADHCILPEEIIVDNDTVYKWGIFKRFWRRLNNLGVITTRSYANIPTWKAEVESSFAVFQKLHSDKPWYIGEDIQSKNIAGNPADEVRKKLYRNKKAMLTVSELETEFAKMVQEYNEMTNDRRKKIAPKDTFRLNPSKRSIKLEDWMIPLLFWKAKTKKRIKNDGRIDLQIDNVEYCYQVTKAEMLWEYKNTDVRMCYDPNDLSKLHIFERGTLKYIGEIEPRMVMKRDNKKEVLKRHKRILKDAQQYLKDSRQFDEDLANGVQPDRKDRKPVSRERLADKLLRNRMRQEKFEREVSEVEVDE